MPAMASSSGEFLAVGVGMGIGEEGSSSVDRRDSSRWLDSVSWG